MSKNFVEELERCMRNEDDPSEIIGIGVGFYGNKIANAINGFGLAEIPFIYAGLIAVMESMKRIDSEAVEVGEAMFDCTKADLHTFVSGNKAVNTK